MKPSSAPGGGGPSSGRGVKNGTVRLLARDTVQGGYRPGLPSSLARWYFNHRSLFDTEAFPPLSLSLPFLFPFSSLKSFLLAFPVGFCLSLSMGVNPNQNPAEVGGLSRKVQLSWKGTRTKSTNEFTRYFSPSLTELSIQYIFVRGVRKEEDEEEKIWKLRPASY